MPLRTKIQIALTLISAAVATGIAAHIGSGRWLPFWLLLIPILLSSGKKVATHRGHGSMSLNFPFILLGIVQLSPLQAILLAAISVAAECRIRVVQIFTAVQIAFNVANTMQATAWAILTFATLHKLHLSIAPALALAALAFFICNTAAVAMVISSSKNESAFSVWRSEYPWYLPFYLVGAVLAALVNWMSEKFGWGTALLLIPVVYILYRSYMGQVSLLEERQQHLEETEALQLRTIEGLAMAIEAKDQNTHDHLFRVRHYVKAVGQTLKLTRLEMQALETAAFLHDIGKLAVPEHIINKPGKLTPEEFEKMKIHPVVGADILERVRFPYPVVPIVRSHHEWWNGTGYPDGLAGTDIPIGARILTVVDCFDALVSDRPYRKGMSGPKALDLIRSLAGRQFDPEVVKAFEICHAEAELRLESLVPSAFTPLNTEVEVSRGVAPGAGFEAGSQDKAAEPASGAELGLAIHGTAMVPTQTAVAAASQEAQELFELSQSLGSSLSPNETVSVIASRLRALIAFDVCAVYVRRGDEIELRFVDGLDLNQFTSKQIPLGEGISGWVAQSRKPILNGNATVEPGCPLSTDDKSALRSGLSVPLFDLEREVFGVLTLYSSVADAFSREDLRILLAMESKLSLSLRNTLQPRAIEADADGEVDFLTGLPNAKQLFLHLESELDRSVEHGRELAVVVCDLNDFKEVNDRRGHLAGNRLLRSVAEGFRDLCEGSETVARMGGDEFVFVLPGLRPDALDDRVVAIRLAVEAAARRAGHGSRISVSVGTASCPADGSLTEDLLATAERRMYREKQRHDSATAARPVEVKQAAPAACNG